MSYRSVFKPGLFEGQTVIVTGGGSGIGRCTAHEIAALGAHVDHADGGALFGQPEGDGPADAAAAAGDDRPPPREPSCRGGHRSPLDLNSS